MIAEEMFLQRFNHRLNDTVKDLLVDRIVLLHYNQQLIPMFHIHFHEAIIMILAEDIY